MATHYAASYTDHKRGAGSAVIGSQDEGAGGFSSLGTAEATWASFSFLTVSLSKQTSCIQPSLRKNALHRALPTWRTFRYGFQS